ncbi:MAG: beta-galactosidase [Lentisphaerae bacterium]|nr:beta-galactosidase [Lentisphaerota bacterium]
MNAHRTGLACLLLGWGGVSAGFETVELVPQPGENYLLRGGSEALTLTAGQGGKLDLTYAVPVELPESAYALKLWLSPAKYLEVSALIRDAAGRVYAQPFRMGRPLYSFNAGWAHYGTGPLEVNPDSYATNRVVVRPLRLTGFALSPDAAYPGTISLHGLTIEERPGLADPRWELASLEDPFSPRTWQRVADSGRRFVDSGTDDRPRIPYEKLFAQPGNYTVGIRCLDRWQGPAGGEVRRQVTVSRQDLDDPSGHALSLPLTAADKIEKCQFVELRIWQADGALDAIHYYWLARYNWPAADVPAEAAGTPGLELAAGDAGVLAATDPAEYRVKVGAAAGPAPRRLKLQVLGFDFSPVTEMTLEVPGQGEWQKTLPLPADPVCRLHAELIEGGQVRDRACLLAGRVTVEPADAAPAAPANPRDRHGLGSNLSFPCVPPAGYSPAECLDHLERGFKWIRESGQDVCSFVVPWAEIEPLPGVFHFDFLDAVLARAERQGVGIALAPWYFADLFPRWLFQIPLRYDDGSSYLYLRARYAVDFAHPEFRAALIRMWDRLLRRYAGHPVLRGYLTTGPHLDAAYADFVPFRLAGYSQAHVAAWREFLHARYQTLPAVAQRYGRPYAAWEEVYPPTPDWTEPYDVRPCWRDFQEFRETELRQFFGGVFETIRQRDPDSFIYQYAIYNSGRIENYFPEFEKHRVGFTAGTSEYENLQKYTSVVSLWGIPYRGEPQASQALPPAGLNMALWTQLPYGTSSLNYGYQWHCEFPTAWSDGLAGLKDLERWNRAFSNPLTRLVQLGTADGVPAWAQVFEELKGAEPPPIEVGCLFSCDYAWYAHRSFFVNHVTGREVAALMNRRLHRLPRWVSDHTPLAKFAGLKALIVDADVTLMADATRANLVGYVRGGGTLITTAVTGAVSLDSGRRDFRFPAELGVTITPSEEQGERSGQLKPAAGGPAGICLRSVNRLEWPPAAEVLARTPDGAALLAGWPLGTGRVFMFAGPVDWTRSADAVEALLNGLKIARRADIVSSNGRMRIFRLTKGTTQYFGVGYLYNGFELDPQTGTPQSGSAELVRIKLPDLPAPQYRVSELTAPRRELGLVSRRELARGFPFCLKPGELVIFRGEPVD